MFEFHSFAFTPTISAYAMLVASLFCIGYAWIRSKKYRTYIRSNQEKKKYTIGIIWVAFFSLITVTVAFFFLLSSPEWHNTKETVSFSGNTLVFALDISKSMLAEDIAPNRIETAKKAITTFIEKSDANGIGLVVFAGEAFTLVPITQDKTTFLNTLHSVTPDTIKQELVGLSGTSIGNALLLSKDLLTRNASQNPVIILLTDGEANTGINPAPVAKSFENENIQAYAIGIGKPEGTDLYITGADGKRQYFMGADGKPIHATLDEWLLQYIASMGHGKYFRVDDTNGMNNAFQALSSLATSEHTTQIQIEKKDLSFYFALLAFFSIIISLWIRRYIWELSFF